MQKLRDIWKAKMEALKAFNFGAKLWPFYLKDKKDKSDFTLSSGIWKDFEIDGSQIRNQAWKRK